MKHIHRNTTVRLVTAMLVTAAVIVLSSLATHAPAQNQSWLTLKNIRTDKATTFYANNRGDCAWFVEMVLPTGHYANNRGNCAWFVEMVLPTGDSKLMTENLNSVAATL
jgi:hemolysin-activating ACP:hemolysin acyltransferase